MFYTCVTWGMHAKSSTLLRCPPYCCFADRFVGSILLGSTDTSHNLRRRGTTWDNARGCICPMTQWLIFVLRFVCSGPMGRHRCVYERFAILPGQGLTSSVFFSSCVTRCMTLHNLFEAKITYISTKGVGRVFHPLAPSSPFQGQAVRFLGGFVHVIKFL